MMKPRTWRKIHRYLGLVIGLQLLLWTLSGAIFSWNSIESVRGEHLIRVREPVDLNSFQIIELNDVLSQAKGESSDSVLTSTTLKTLLGRPVFELTFDKGTTQSFVLYDAVDGKKKSPIDEEMAKQIALDDFSEPAQVNTIELFESTSSHSEYRKTEFPVYRVVLDDPGGTAIWVSVDRGAIVARRNTRWRIFDFFWMLHTMDYQGRDNFNSWVLKGVSVFGLITVLSGFVLWFQTTRVFRNFRKKRPD